MNTFLRDALGVRDMLGSPLEQSPSFEEIFFELDAEYQSLTNQLNLTGDAWTHNEITVTTVAGQRTYQILPTNNDFYKALKVVTVPDNISQDPEYVLEFAEVEHLSNEWAWLGQNKGQLFDSSHDSQLVAFYRKMGAAGEEVWIELRPTPASVQQYRIVYQQSVWEELSRAAGKDYTSPHSALRTYIRCCAARNILQRQRVKWSFDEAKNAARIASMLAGIETRIRTLQTEVNNYRLGLDHSDVVHIDAWADDNIYID